MPTKTEPAATPSDRPNVLMITCHDLGRRLGCYDRPTRSPAIDRLASEGVRFERYFVCAPQCSPSRASLTTGRHPHRTGVLGLVGKWGWQMDGGVPTLAKTFGAAGYDTWLWGFQHEHPDPSALGYTHDPIGYGRGEVHKILADHVGPRLCDWLTGPPGGPDRPWFASVGFFETHLPWPRAVTSPGQSTRAAVPEDQPDLPALRQDMAGFDASLDTMDRHVDRVLEALDRSGQADRTIVVFTTDHGLPLPRAKCDLRDVGLEAALIVRWPNRLHANRVCGEMLSGIDLAPTLYDLAGVDPPAGMDGQGFAGLLTGGYFTPRDAIFAQQTWHSQYRPLRSIRTHRHKLIQRFNDFPENSLPGDFYETCAAVDDLRTRLDRVTPARLELYDLAADPLELHPRVAVSPDGLTDVGRGLYDRLMEHMRQTQDPLLDGPIAPPTVHGQSSSATITA